MINFLHFFLFTYSLLLGCLNLKAQHTNFQTGDIFLGQGGGIIQWRDSNKVLLKNINTGDGGGNGNGTGLRIHPLTGQLWITNSNLPPNSTKGIRIINTDGTIGNTIDVSAYQQNPTSVSFDNQGNAYIGDLWNKTIVKINSSGTVILNHYTVSTNNFVWGPEWVEMDCNDSIIYYTHLKETIKRYNVVTNQQLSDFANITGVNTWFFAMRRLPDSTMIVTSADNRLLRLNATGNIIQQYLPPSPCGFFGLATTPDGKSFWAGGLAPYGKMFKFNITTGIVVDSFLAAPTLSGINIHGIAIYGDNVKNCYPQSQDTILNKKITVYPNPSRGYFRIKTSLVGNLRISIYNNFGKLVYRKFQSSMFTNVIIPISLPHVLAGVYYVQLANDKQTIINKIIIN